MDGNLGNSRIFPTAKNDSKVSCSLIDIVQNICNANNDSKKKTVEKNLLNPDSVDAISTQNPRICLETPKRLKRRRESEPTALDEGHTTPGSDGSKSSDPTWEKSLVKKRLKKSSEKELTFPQRKKLTSPPPNNEEANETTWTNITTQFRPNLQKQIPTGEKPFTCGQCDFTANRSTYLQQHERTHTGEKPFKCGQCDYRASQKAHLQVHERAHTGERPFKCDHCDYRASQSSSLRTHERTHTGEKPHKCGYCDYRSSHISSLRRHVRTHTALWLLFTKYRQS